MKFYTYLLYQTTEMSLTDEIDDIYIKYLLLNKQMHLLCQQTKKSRTILNKYIAIKENIDLELYPLLNDKKKNDTRYCIIPVKRKF